MSGNIGQYVPLFLCFLSGFGFSIQALILNDLGSYGFNDTCEVIFFRGCIQSIFASFFIYTGTDRTDLTDRSLFGSTMYIRCLLFLRGLFGFIAMTFAFIALQRLPIGDCMVLVMLSPLIASIAAVFILGEPFRIPEQIASITSIIGVILVGKPSVLFGHHSETTSLLGTIYALLSALFAGAVFMILRLLGTTAKMPWPNVTFVQGLCQMIFIPPTLYLTQQSFRLNLSFNIFSLILIAGIVSSASQMCMTIGMQREKSALAGAMRMSDIVFSFLWQALFTNDTVNGFSVLGALLIMASILMVVLTKVKDIKSSISSSPSSSNTSSTAIDEKHLEPVVGRDRNIPLSQLVSDPLASILERATSSLLSARWNSAIMINKLIRSHVRESVVEMKNENEREIAGESDGGQEDDPFLQSNSS